MSILFSLILEIYLILENGGTMDYMIGQRIRQRRKELHITQTEIQTACGISSGNLSGIETGRYLPSAITLIELAKILHCSVDWILTGESLISNNSTFADINESEQQLLNYFSLMSDLDKEDLLMIAAMKANKRKVKQEATLSHSGSSNTTIETA